MSAFRQPLPACALFSIFAREVAETRALQSQRKTDRSFNQNIDSCDMGSNYVQIKA
jgi:hypothetical protein